MLLQQFSGDLPLFWIFFNCSSPQPNILRILLHSVARVAYVDECAGQRLSGKAVQRYYLFVKPQRDVAEN